MSCSSRREVRPSGVAFLLASCLACSGTQEPAPADPTVVAGLREDREIPAIDPTTRVENSVTLTGILGGGAEGGDGANGEERPLVGGDAEADPTLLTQEVSVPRSADATGDGAGETGDTSGTPAGGPLETDSVQEQMAESAFDAIDEEYGRFNARAFAFRAFRTLADDLAQWGRESSSAALALTERYISVVHTCPLGGSPATAARYRVAEVWNTLLLKWAALPDAMPQEMPPELLETLAEVVAGVRHMEVLDGMTVSEVIDTFLAGDGSEASHFVLGALPYAERMGIGDDDPWVQRARALRDRGAGEAAE